MSITRKPVEQTSENVILPNEQAPKNTNQYESILQLVEEQSRQIEELKRNQRAATGDISEEVKQSKRKYGYDFSNNRIPEEKFKFSYRVLMYDRAERVVVSSKTVGRPVNFRNENTGKWTNVHNVEVEFHDGTKAEMDVLDYINQFYKQEEFVSDEDIKTVDGKTYYTFRTEKFGTFTIEKPFIN